MEETGGKTGYHAAEDDGSIGPLRHHLGLSASLPLIPAAGGCGPTSHRCPGLHAASPGFPRQPQRSNSAQHPRQRMNAWRCGAMVVPRPGRGASPGRGPLEKGDQPRSAEPSLTTRLLPTLPPSPPRPTFPTLAPGAVHPDNMFARQPLPQPGFPGDAGRAGQSCLKPNCPHSTQNRTALRGSWGIRAGGSASLLDQARDKRPDI